MRSTWLILFFATVAAGAEPASTLVTLHIANTKPDEALALLNTVANTKIKVTPDDALAKSTDTITLDLDGVPFWTALSQFCKQAHLHPQIDASDTITLGTGDVPGTLGGKMDDRGLFAVVAVGAHHNRQISLADLSTNRNDSVELNVLADPAVAIVRCSGTAHLDLADDDQHISMLPTNEGENDLGGTIFGGTTWAFTANASLNYPPTPGKKIAHLKGSVRALIASKFTDLQFDDAVNSVGKEITDGKRTLLLKEFKIENDYTVSYHLVLSKPPGTPTYYVSIINEQRFLKLIDAQGHAVNVTGGGSASEDQFEMSGHAQGRDVHFNSGKVKLVWHVATETQSVDVPFDFTDLSLPGR